MRVAYFFLLFLTDIFLNGFYQQLVNSDGSVPDSTIEESKSLHTNSNSTNILTLTDDMNSDLSDEKHKPHVHIILLSYFFTYFGIMFLVIATFMTVTCIVYWILLPRTYAFAAAFNPPFSQPPASPRSYTAAVEINN